MGWAWGTPRGYGAGWGAGGLRRLALQEADTDDQQGTLGFDEFCAFYKMMSTRRDLYLLMLTYSTHKGPLDAADLQRFLQVEQKVRQPQGRGPGQRGLGSAPGAAGPWAARLRAWGRGHSLAFEVPESASACPRHGLPRQCSSGGVPRSRGWVGRPELCPPGGAQTPRGQRGARTGFSVEHLVGPGLMAQLCQPRGRWAGSPGALGPVLPVCPADAQVPRGPVGHTHQSPLNSGRVLSVLSSTVLCGHCPADGRPEVGRLDPWSEAWAHWGTRGGESTAGEGKALPWGLGGRPHPLGWREAEFLGLYLPGTPPTRSWVRPVRGKPRATRPGQGLLGAPHSPPQAADTALGRGLGGGNRGGSSCGSRLGLCGDVPPAADPGRRPALPVTWGPNRGSQSPPPAPCFGALSCVCPSAWSPRCWQEPGPGPVGTGCPGHLALGPPLEQGWEQRARTRPGQGVRRCPRAP